MTSQSTMRNTNGEGNTMTKTTLRKRTLGLASLLGLLLASAPAQAGRGSSAAAIDQAIRSGSVNAIESELERAELLVCPGCSRLVLPLIDHEDARVRRVAAWWLARRGGRSALFVEMAERLAQPDSVRARNAADVLGELRTTKALTPLGAALNNPVFDAEARAAMARALGEIGHLDAVPSLRQAFGADAPAVRAAAVAALRQLRGFQDASLARGALTDASAEVRLQAIDTIAFLRGEALRGAGAEDLARALADLATRDGDDRVRRKAVWALGEIGAPAAIAGPALQQAAADEHPLVRSLAEAAMARLTH